MTTIKLKNGSGAPTAGDLVQGEPALDLTNKRLYTEDSGGTVIEVGTNPGTDVTFADNRKAIFGAGSDLQIYHDGSNSYVSEAGTGNLYLNTTNGGGVFLTSAGENLAGFNSNGAVNLYYDNAAKLATTSTGIDVTGTVTADGLTISSATANVADLRRANNTGAGQVLLGNSDGHVRLSGTNGSFDVFNSGNTAQKFGIAANGDISFYEDTGTTAKLFWDASAESLGIGTTSPNEKLVSSGTVRALGATTSNESSTTLSYSSGVGAVEVRGPDVSTRGAINLYQAASNGSLGQTALHIDSSGNVGIGTSSPSQMLELSANNGLSGVANVLRFNDSDVGVTAAQPTGRIEFAENDGGNTTVSAFLEVETVSTSGGGEMTFGTGAAGVTATERMRIDSSGNLLVGTTTHRNFSGGTTEITVGTSTTGATAGGAVTFGSGSGFLGYVAFQESEGTLGTLTSVPLLLKTGNTERMRIDSSGNVGIGTSSPQAYLHVYGNNAETLRLQGNDEYTYLSFRGTVGTEQTFGYLGFANDTGNAADLNLTNSQAGAISFSANGAERMRIDSNGNVGIGTSSPDTRLDLGSVAASTQTAILARNSTGDADFKLVAATDSGTASNTSFFEMGIAYETGVYQPNAMLKFFRGGGSTGGFLAFTTNDDTERMRLDGSGNLLVGKTSTAFGTQGIVLNANGVIDVTKDGDAALFLNRLTSDGAIAIFHKAGTDVGSIDVTASATSYNTSSDQRLKDNIVDAPSASDDIDAIQVRSFDWRVDGSHQKYGMVAQELQSVAPEAVTGDADSDDMMGVDYSKLVPMMMKEIQSLRARVAQLEGEN